MITVENLNKSFFQNQNQISILKNLSLQVNAGEVIGLVGQSGSGKTIFLTLMSGLEKPDTGRILVNDTDLVKLSEEQLTQFRAKNISILYPT